MGVAKFEVYEERDEFGYKSSGQWRWRLRSPNNQVMATSNEGFISKGNAVRACKDVYAALISIGYDEPPIEEVDA